MRLEIEHRHQDWFNGAVPSFGSEKTAKLLVVGLAPGMRGAHKTGRPFTGDDAGDLLYSTLLHFGFASGMYGGHLEDGLQLVEAMVTNAVRCLPPGNKPTAAEINTCRAFLIDRIATLPELRVIVALGRVAHESIVKAFSLRTADYKFAHGARYKLHDGKLGTHCPTDGLVLIDSYHCSRYNTNTRRLTTEMFHDVFRAVRQELDRDPAEISTRG